LGRFVYWVIEHLYRWGRNVQGFLEALPNLTIKPFLCQTIPFKPCMIPPNLEFVKPL